MQMCNFFGNLLKCIYMNISNRYRKVLTNSYRLHILFWPWCQKIQGHNSKVDIAAWSPSNIVESNGGDTEISQFNRGI